MQPSSAPPANHVFFIVGIMVMYLLYGSTVRKGAFRGSGIIWAGVFTGFLAVTLTVLSELPAYHPGVGLTPLFFVSPLMMVALTAFCITVSYKQQQVRTVGTHVVGDTKFLVISCPAVGIPDAGALIVPTNTALRQNDPVGRLIAGAAGPEAQRELAKLGPVNRGKVVATGPGKLSVGRILYAAVMEPSKKIETPLLKKGIESAFQQARKANAESVAIPLGPLPGLTMADGFEAVIAGTLRHHKAFGEVVFLVFDSRAAGVANTIATRVLAAEEAGNLSVNVST